MSSGDRLHHREKAFSPAVYIMRSMSVAPTALKEALCDRLILLRDASGLPKGKFADRVGLTPSQLTNISNYRNAPAHEVIAKAAHEFGLTIEWFYTGSTVGFRDPKLAERLRELAARASA